MLFSKINKIILLGILILIVPTYGNQSTHLKARDSQESTPNTLFKDFVVEDEDIVAYILKEDYKDKDKCELTLEKYCKELRDIDEELDKVYSKVEQICKNIEEKCKDIKAKIKAKVDEFTNSIRDFMVKGNFYKECD